MLIRMRNIFLYLVIWTLAGETIAEDKFTGLFSLVTESDCYAEVEFFADGKGEFRDICSAESVSAKLSVIRTEFSWYQQAGKIIVSLPNSKKTFEYRASLSCYDFGYTGHSPGVVSEGMNYFKIPLDCK